MIDLLFAPFEVLRRDLERIKTAVDSTVAPLLNLDLQNPELRVEEDLLTHAEHEVLRLARLGLSNREIAEQLGISIGTVRVHFKDIRRRVGVASREEAVEAFGKPTERERVSFVTLRLPRVIAAPYERRAAGLLTLVDELERSPSMETVGRLEDELHDLAGEVGGAAALTSGFEREKLTDLYAKLSTVIQDAAVARAAIETMERETLPMRIESGRRAFSSAIRLLRRDLWIEIPGVTPEIPGVLTPERAAELRARLPRRFSRFIGSCRVDEGQCLTHGYPVSKTMRCPGSELTDDEWQTVWELAEEAFPDGQSNPRIDTWWPATMGEVERAVSNYAIALRGAARKYAERAREAAAKYSESAEKAIHGYRQYTLAEYYKGREAGAPLTIARTP